MRSKYRVNQNDIAPFLKFWKKRFRGLMCGAYPIKACSLHDKSNCFKAQLSKFATVCETALGSFRFYKLLMNARSEGKMQIFTIYYTIFILYTIFLGEVNVHTYNV